MKRTLLLCCCAIASLVSRAQVITFDEPYYIATESDGTLEIIVNLDAAPLEAATVEVSLSSVGTALVGTDFVFTDTTLTLPVGSDAPVPLSLPLVDNDQEAFDRYFVLELNNPTGVTLGDESQTVIYLLDDEASAPAPSGALSLEFMTSYLVAGGSGSAEIVDYDPATERLFIVNSDLTQVEILDFSDPMAIQPVGNIDMSAFGDAATSVAVANGLVAATVEGEDFSDGAVVFFDTDGNNPTSVSVGVLPDMVTFTPDGTKVLTANEGEPSDDYLTDPEGSISIIDVTGGLADIDQNDVTTVGFNDFDSQIADLRAAGVRIFGPSASVSQDLEPEFITVSVNSDTAWVALQENNALAVVDLTVPAVVAIQPLGVKDHSLPENGLDGSNDLDSIFIAPWPIVGMYQPDAIAAYTVAGNTYVVTANEGDAREYDAYEEESDVEDLTLDPTAYPDADILQLETNLGPLKATLADGDTDGDGDIDLIHVYGGRSFSIRAGATGALVYDSGNDFERITAADPVFGSLFNASNSNNTFKNRSDNKGPEPEGVIVEEIGNRFYAFIGLERIGGIMTYDVTDPTAPTFVSYVNSRTTEGDEEGGDLGPEGLLYVDQASSPTDTALLVVANEVSATLSIYKVIDVIVSLNEETFAAAPFSVYPNPARGAVYFSRPASYCLFDVRGRVVRAGTDAASFRTDGLSAGLYFVRTADGQTAKVVVE